MSGWGWGPNTRRRNIRGRSLRSLASTTNAASGSRGGAGWRAHERGKMSTVPIDARSDIDLARELEQFLYIEAALLEDRRWDEWLALWAEDAHWSMPVRSERPGR